MNETVKKLDKQTKILLLSVLKKGYFDCGDIEQLSKAALLNINQITIFKIPDNGRDESKTIQALRLKVKEC